jgi:hypothetical protein
VALQNGTGAILAKLAVISVPFLLGATGYLLNAAIAARDAVTHQEILAIGGKVDDLAGRIDALASIVRADNDRVIATQGDVRELQAQQRATERRLDERSRH